MIIQNSHSKTHIKLFLLLLIPALVNQKISHEEKKNKERKHPAAGFALLGSDGASYCDWDNGGALNGCHRQMMLLHKQVIQHHIPEPTVLCQQGRRANIIYSATHSLFVSRFSIYFLYLPRG